jgi:hypothetical protein
LKLLRRDLSRIEGHREQLPAISCALQFEVHGQLRFLETCGDTRQRLDVSSALLWDLSPN